MTALQLDFVHWVIGVFYVKMEARMRYDDIAWEQSELLSDAWPDQRIYPPEFLREIGNFLVEHQQAYDALALLWADHA